MNTNSYSNIKFINKQNSNNYFSSNQSNKSTNRSYFTSYSEKRNFKKVNFEMLTNEQNLYNKQKLKIPNKYPIFERSFINSKRKNLQNNLNFEIINSSFSILNISNSSNNYRNMLRSRYKSNKEKIFEKEKLLIITDNIEINFLYKNNFENNIKTQKKIEFNIGEFENKIKNMKSKIHNSKKSYSEFINENFKIKFIQQRLEIQTKSMNKEKKEIQDEIIKVK